MAELTFVGAVNQALRDEMQRDRTVYVLGEDVAEGGPYGATKDLVEAFGVNRVRNTPISEATVSGIAIGAALVGLRPVIEIMFIDFITLALDQLVNHAAKIHYMSGGQLRVPMVLRTQGGVSRAAGAQHSQSLEAWLVHVPGLKVVMPSNPADAAGLLKSAIRDDNPVVFVETKAIYFQKGSVDNGCPPVPIGSAKVVRKGRDLTVVATSTLVWESLAAAEELATKGIELEVIDPRTLTPLDAETIQTSVSRTHRLLVTHEAVQQGGFGAEVAALFGQIAFDDLDAPVVRVGAPFTPVPFNPNLEKAFAPGRAQIIQAVEALLPG